MGWAAGCRMTAQERQGRPKAPSLFTNHTGSRAVASTRVATVSRPRLLDVFAVERDIQTLALLLFGDAQPDGQIDYLEDDETHDEAVDEGRADTPALGQHAALHSADLLGHEGAG